MEHNILNETQTFLMADDNVEFHEESGTNEQFIPVFHKKCKEEEMTGLPKQKGRAKQAPMDLVLGRTAVP